MSGRTLLPGPKDERVHRSRPRKFAAIAALLSVAFAGVVVGTAAAERDQPAAHAAAQWLGQQLKPHGTLDKPLSRALPGRGLMIDVLLAAHASGHGPLAAPVVQYLDEGGHASDYFTWG